MGSPEGPYPNALRNGDPRSCSGRFLIEAAKAGRLWINVREAMNLHPEYQELLDRMYGELAERTGVRRYQARGAILISSPTTVVPYHCDARDTVLWHIRGQKTFYVYPDRPPYLPDAGYEAVVLQERDEDLPYHPSLEAGATRFELEADQMVSWVLNSPHRVENQSYCVSVTTEFSTRASGFKNAVTVTKRTDAPSMGDEPELVQRCSGHQNGEICSGSHPDENQLVPTLSAQILHDLSHRPVSARLYH
ncbi:MAG: hypothetical protein HC857_05150 [Synechococcales cyanobacterium RU_4_20]|nr:hypothetical protein [Synechococcales cyanobacterium RU_4_20]